MKKLRKYKFSSEELANQYINSISQENSAILLNNLTAAQTVESGANPAFDKNQPASLENNPVVFSPVDFANQYLVDVVWQNEVNSAWNEFEVFPLNSLWRNRIFNQLTTAEKIAVKSEYSHYLNNKNFAAVGAPLLLENDFRILGKYVMAFHFNKEGAVLTGESVSLDAKSVAAVSVYTIHDSCNVNYNIKLETDNTEDVLKVLIFENELSESPMQTLFEINSTEIKNGVIALQKGNVILMDYVKNSYSETNKVTFTLSY